MCVSNIGKGVKLWIMIVLKVIGKKWKVKFNRNGGS